MDKNELANRLETMARGEGAVQIADILDAAAALRESEEWRRDAERYGWLRTNCEEVADDMGTAAQLYFGTYTAGKLDDEIDAARKEGA